MDKSLFHANGTTVSGFMVIGLIFYCLAIGYMLLFFGTSFKWLINAGDTVRKLDNNLELSAASLCLERDIKRASADLQDWYSSGNDPVSEFVFIMHGNNNACCGWGIKNNMLRRIEGDYSFKKHAWLRRNKISVVLQNVKKLKCRRIEKMGRVVGIHIAIITHFGNKLSRLIALNNL